MTPNLDNLSRRLSGVYGVAAADWSDQLPSLEDELVGLWELETEGSNIPASYSYVVPVRLPDGSRAILKLRFPSSDADREMDALRAFGGRGAVRLIRSDRERGALLIERLSPGHGASAMDDQASGQALAAIMDSLHSVTPEAGMFPTTAEWGRGFERYARAHPDGMGPIPVELVETGEAQYRKLENSAEGPVLLHGDLHHENMLFDQERGWIAIDPQGVVGEPAYEMGAFLRNPIVDLARQPDLTVRARRRAELLSGLTGVDGKRILGWAVAQAVLSAIWAWEDQEPEISRWVSIAAGLEAAWNQR